MSIQTRFVQFHDKIKLSREDDAYSKAREKDDSVTADVKAAFREEGYPVVEDFIQGSLGTHTGIKNKTGDFDIDRAVVVDKEDAPENPVNPKVVICDDVLKKRGFKNAKVKKPCVTADYASENLHIDYPVYRKSGNVYELAVGKRGSDQNNRKWEDADPKGLLDWVKDKSAYIGSADQKLWQFYRVVRYLKRWRNEKFSEDVCRKVYSVGITVMAKRCFCPSMDAEGQLSDLNALKDTVSGMLTYGFFTPQGNDQYKVSVTLPVAPYRDIFDGSSINTGTQFRNKLKRLETKLDDALDETDEKKRCEILRDMFGDDFPECDSKKNSGDSTKKIFPAAGVVGTSHGA